MTRPLAFQKQMSRRCFLGHRSGSRFLSPSLSLPTFGPCSQLAFSSALSRSALGYTETAAIFRVRDKRGVPPRNDGRQRGGDSGREPDRVDLRPRNVPQLSRGSDCCGRDRGELGGTLLTRPAAIRFTIAVAMKRNLVYPIALVATDESSAGCLMIEFMICRPRNPQSLCTRRCEGLAILRTRGGLDEEALIKTSGIDFFLLPSTPTRWLE